VAGTNGKGTTSGMIWRLLSAAGFKVGLFTSPHLSEFRERITVSGHDVTNTLLVESITRIRKQLKPELWADLTFFEINTLLAFMVFEQLETEINVLEVGLGGRLDCVNVYDPDVAVITSIGLDHMEFLGDSLTLIAREKAGIMREGRPVIWCAEQWAEPEADVAITAVAKEVGAMIVMDDNFSSLVAGVEEGRFAYDNVRKVIYLSISTGAAEILLFLFSVSFAMPIPLLAVQLLWLNIDGGMKLSNIQRITTYGTNFYTTTNYIYEPDQLQMSLGFNLSKKDRKINLPVSEMGEKEF
jgi:folylpolyglutamate synthase/dihydrofolate synthase